MARPQKLTIDKQLKAAQEEYIESRTRCDELAKEIERLSKLRQEERAKNLIEAMAKYKKSYEEVMAFIQGIADEGDD